MIVSHRDYPNPHSVISTVQKKDLLSIKILKNITIASNFRKIPYQLRKERRNSSVILIIKTKAVHKNKPQRYLHTIRVSFFQKNSIFAKKITYSIRP